MKLLLLSPHRDDAAFSLTNTLQHWLKESHEITMLNVFTQSIYVPCEDLSRVPVDDQLSYVSAMRRNENEEFVGILARKLSLADLELEDAPLRLHCHANEVCDMEVSAEDEGIPRIRGAVEEWLKAQAKDERCGLILPLALGHHVDHRVVRDAALHFTATVASAFYEDLPYAVRPGVDQDFAKFRGEIRTSQHATLLPALCGSSNKNSIRNKRRLVSSYRSQIDSEQMDAIANFAERYDGAERIWVNQAWLDAAGREAVATEQAKVEAELLS